MLLHTLPQLTHQSNYGTTVAVTAALQFTAQMCTLPRGP